MAYQLEPGETAIQYAGQNYIITVTNVASNFQIKSLDGILITVPIDTASELFSSAKAITLLRDLHQQANIDSSISAWNAVQQSTDQILTEEGALNLLSTASGVFLAAAIGGPTLLEGSIEALPGLIGSETAPVFDANLTGALINNATSMLINADTAYNSYLANQSSVPIPFWEIEFALNNTLGALFLGNTAANAAANIPGVNQSLWDDVLGFFKGLVAPVASAITEGVGVFNNVAQQLPELVGLLSDSQSLADTVDTVSSANDQITFLTSILNQVASYSELGTI